MRKSIRKIILISILPAFLITGCISSRSISQAGKEYYRPPALSQELLDNRIEAIKNLLKEDNLSDDRKDTAVSILKAYDKLKPLNRGNSTEKEYRKTVQLLFKSLVDIEQQYFDSSIISEDSAGKNIIENYSLLKKQIYEAYFSGDFSGVISGCSQIEARFGKNGLTSDLGIMFVEALTKNNMTSEALSLARSILGAVEARPDLIRLLADVIDLELKTGNIEDAKRHYEKLVDNINERYATYQEAGKLISKYQSGNSVFDESIKEKITKIDPEKTIQTERFLDNIKKLIGQKDFSGARMALIRWRLRAEEVSEVEMIEQLLKSVDKAEEQFSNENSNGRLFIADAKKLIEEEKYEEALDILEPIVDEGGNYEAEKVQKEAIEKLINMEKLSAAKIFNTAMGESNLQRKRELLLRAKLILNSLIDKYPASPLLEMSKKNILRIDDELMKLPAPIIN